jgi:hypothetical protein
VGTGPSTKETTLHHYHDPLCKALVTDTEVDFLGIILAGTSDDNEHKTFVARRIGTLIEAMRPDGVLVSIDSWGNCHIDFASVIEAVGERNIPVVGLSFVGTQAAFVVVNSYMNSIIDLNKTSEGVENLVMGENTAVELDAVKALSILKTKIRRKSPEKSWYVNEVKNVRRLILRSFDVKEMVCGAGNTAFSAGYLSLNIEELLQAGRASSESMKDLICDFSVRLLNPAQRDTQVNSILDFSPISVKIAGHTGEGISHVFSGLCVMLTAVEESGFQPANVGASNGILVEKVCFGRPGTPQESDYILNIDVTLKDGKSRSREGIMAAHQLCDTIVRSLRDKLRSLSSSEASDKKEYWDIVRHGGYKIALVKLVPALGCLYDTLLFPSEPGGYTGGKSIMDRSNNVQIVLTPNEYRDGAVRSLT